MKIINKFTVSLLVTAKLPVLFAAALPELFISVDPAWLTTKPGKTQEVNVENDLGNIYVNQTRTVQKNTAILGVGIRSYQNEQFQITTSLRYVPVSSMVLQGQIWQLKSPLFNDSGYRFQTKSTLMLLDNIISWDHYRWQPGVILGVGFSRNSTDGFHEVPLTDTAFPSLQVINGAKSYRIATELGAALDYAINPIIIEFAYRYINAGTGHLQAFPLQSTNDVLSTGTLKYQLFSLGIRAYYV